MASTGGKLHRADDLVLKKLLVQDQSATSLESTCHILALSRFLGEEKVILNPGLLVMWSLSCATPSTSKLVTKKKSSLFGKVHNLHQVCVCVCVRSALCASVCVCGREKKTE